MNKISVYILAFNQIHKIADAIESVLWADEVVLVDSFSTDGTAELAEKMGAKVIQVPFVGFGDLRNQAVAHCSHEWIFSLDSDERCTKAARDEIRAIIDSENPKDIYFVPRKNYFMGRWIKHSGWYPNYRQPQLFRKGCVTYRLDLVHEDYTCHSSHSAGYLKNAIIQIPFMNLSEMMDKAQRYTTLGAERLQQKGCKASMWTALTHSMWAFFKHYVLQRGFLDGWPGWIIAFGHSYGAFYRYAKFYELMNDEKEVAKNYLWK